MISYTVAIILIINSMLIVNLRTAIVILRISVKKLLNNQIKKDHMSFRIKKELKSPKEHIDSWIEASERFIRLNSHRVDIGHTEEKKLFKKAIKRHRGIVSSLSVLKLKYFKN